MSEPRTPAHGAGDIQSLPPSALVGEVDTINCRACGRRLSVPRSRARRLGPKCRSHLPAKIASISGFDDVVVHINGDTLVARLEAS